LLIRNRIIFRAFQGVGGGGVYTMTFVILPEMVPKEKYALYAGIISGVAAMSSLMGPIFGGVISDQGTWKWIFLLKYNPYLSVSNRDLLLT
jgi:MFS family permease